MVAFVTPLGIRFEDAYYACHEALQGQWYRIAEVVGDWPVRVKAGAEKERQIYIFVEEKYIPCFRLYRSVVSEEFRQAYFTRIQALKEMKRQQDRKSVLSSIYDLDREGN